MLNERIKKNLREAVESANHKFGIEGGQKLGPVKVVDLALLATANHPSVEAKIDNMNLQDNREEAEKFVAGILGMM